jgi:heme/copper-type cytochrome/quinol oxidase subunit 1
MNQVTVRCIKAAFCFLALGIALGASFAIDRSIGAGLRSLHAQFNLWGWSTLLIYGMAYHMLPRFLGRPLTWPKLAEWQSWLAIIGVSILSFGLLGQRFEWPLALVCVVLGALLQGLAALAFACQVGTMLQKR